LTSTFDNCRARYAGNARADILPPLHCADLPPHSDAVPSFSGCMCEPNGPTLGRGLSDRSRLNGDARGQAIGGSSNRLSVDGLSNRGSLSHRGRLSGEAGCELSDSWLSSEIGGWLEGSGRVSG